MRNDRPRPQADFRQHQLATRSSEAWRYDRCARNGSERSDNASSAVVARLSYCDSTLYRSGMSRRARDARRRDRSVERLAQLATSDVYWDELVSIAFDGEEEVYDLTVEGPHNFVAENIVVHNSIEQDADVVMFVYRDEYYNPEDTESAGIAELHVAKHRNGPTDMTKLAFQKRYAKFSDLAAA